MAPILCRVGLALVVLSWSEAEAILGSRPAVLLSSHRVRSHSPRLALSESDVDVKKKEITECILDAETPEELAACMEEAEQNLFTLEPRDDGWNDVRTAVTAFKKERAGALEQLKSNYQRDTENIRSSPAYRWTKVLAGELIDVIGSGAEKVELPKVGLPSAPEAPALPSVNLPKVALPKVALPKVELPKVELPRAPAPPPPPAKPEREYATERQRQVASAIQTVASLIPETKPKPAAEAARPEPKAVPKDEASSSVNLPLLLLGYLAIPAAVAFATLGDSLDLGALFSSVSEALPDAVPSAAE